MIPPQAAMALVGAMGNKEEDKPQPMAAMRAQQNASMQQMFDDSARRVAPKTISRPQPPMQQASPMAPAPMGQQAGNPWMQRPSPMPQPMQRQAQPMQGMQGNPWMRRF